MSLEVFFEASTWFFKAFDFALKLLLLWPFVVDMMILLGLWRSFDWFLGSFNALIVFWTVVIWSRCWWSLANPIMGFANLRVEKKFYCNKVCVRDRDTELLDFWMLEQQPLWMELCMFVFFSFHWTTTTATATNQGCCCSDWAFQKLWLLFWRASLQLVCMTFQPEWIPKDFSKPFPSLLQSLVAGRGDRCGFFLVVKKFTTLRLFLEGWGVDLHLCRWEAQGYFKPNTSSAAVGGGEPFVISMPPPNVTGALHMGHAMFVTLEVILFFSFALLCFAYFVLLGEQGIVCSLSERVFDSGWVMTILPYCKNPWKMEIARWMIFAWWLCLG